MSKFQTYTLLFFIGFSVCCLSQANTDKIPLISALKQLETKHNVKFSFADKTVESISVFKLYPELSLEQSLKNLSLQTGLEYTILNKRFISVIKPKTDFKLQRLDEVFIQNYLTKGLSKNINGSVEIASQKFGILPGLSEPDIFQTIQTLPSITSADERVSNINVRGGTNDQNLILYEGIRMYQNGHFFGLISAFNPYLTEKVEVVVNGTQTKYGSGVSSLIHMKTSNDISDNFEAGAGFNLLSIDGFSKFQLSKKTEVQLSARRSYTDALLTPTYDRYFERIFNNSALNENQTEASQLQQNDRFFFYDASLKLLHDFNENSKIRANVITIFNRLDYDFNPVNAANTTAETNSELSQESFATNVSYHKRLADATQLNTMLYFSNYSLFGNNIIQATTQQLTQENKVSDLGLRVDFLKPIDNGLNLNFGYQFNNVVVSNLEVVSNPNFRSFVSNSLATHSIYSEAEFTSASKKTYGRVGLRGNYIGKLNSILFEPRFSFSQKINNTFRLEILGEIKSQSISQITDLQQDFFGIEKRRWQLANDDIVPIIKSNQLSVGLNYKKNGLLISAEGFLKNVSGITTRSQGFQNQFQLVDATGNYNIKGIDILFNKQFKNFSTWFSYSFSDNNYEFDGLNNEQSFPNNIDIQHVVSVSSAYETENLNLSAGINWHTGKPFTLPSQNQLNSGALFYESPNAERLPDYMRFDVSARYKFQFAKNVNAEVGASIWNILSEKNTINRFYSRNRDEPIIQNDELSLQLTPNFSFRLKF